METTTVRINGLDLAYVEAGDGPLAMLLHGFPETPAVFDRLIPELVRAGYRAVAPYMRAFAPSAVPDDGDMTLPRLIEDATGLHDALGGDDRAVLVGHDWGGFTTWGSAIEAPGRWERVVVLDVPPLSYYAAKGADPALIQKNNHFYFFQMAVADQIVALDDFAYLDALWEHWLGASPELPIADVRDAGKRSLGAPANLHAAIDLYRQNMPPAEFGTADWAMPSVLHSLPAQPTLYLHGSEDPIMDQASMAQLEGELAPGSEVALLPGVGHFPLVESATEVNRRIVEFLRPAG